MGLLRKVTGKTVSRKDATAQRKTFLYFDLILNRKDAKGAKVFLMPFSDRNGRSGKTQGPGKTTVIWDVRVGRA